MSLVFLSFIRDPYVTIRMTMLFSSALAVFLTVSRLMNTSAIAVERPDELANNVIEDKAPVLTKQELDTLLSKIFGGSVTFCSEDESNSEAYSQRNRRHVDHKELSDFISQKANDVVQKVHHLVENATAINDAIVRQTVDSFNKTFPVHVDVHAPASVRLSNLVLALQNNLLDFMLKIQQSFVELFDVQKMLLGPKDVPIQA